MDHVNAALEEVLTSLDESIARLTTARKQGEPDAAQELAFYRPQRRAYAKAQDRHLNAGVAATWTGSAWLVPSATTDGAAYRVARIGEVLVCDCKASANQLLCWHKCLAEAYERAAELADDDDHVADAAETLPPLAFTPPSRAPFDDDAAYAEMLAQWGRAA